MATKAERFAKPINPAHLPQGFAVAATYAGIKNAISPSPSKPPANPKPDLALITTAVPVAAAGTFTKNAFKAAPVVLSSNLLLQGASSSNGSRAKSVLVNSGCANAVTGMGGYEDASRCATLVSELLPAENQEDNKTLLLSTGVIGVPLPMGAIQDALPRIADKDILNSSEQSWWEVARAFMTTDTFPKLRAKTFNLGGRKCGIVGIDKGAGMIHPAMTGPQGTTGGNRQLHATLLGLVCTDAPISPEALQSALEHAMARSFNCISVDGDMSTNDTVIALASGLAPILPDAEGGELALEPGEEITEQGHPQEYAQFVEELTTFCKELSHLIVRDGEGAEKFVEIDVRGAPTYEHAHRIASSISTSALVKCALHGSDANWGRILCAVGYADLPSAGSGQQKKWEIDPLKVNVQFLPRSGQGLPDDAAVPGSLVVLKDGAPVGVDEAEAAKLLEKEDIFLRVDLQGGSWGPAEGAKESATYWTCDLSKEYVAINGDYRT
ncbi:Arginine biosynthesis bifunctional protein ArgJ beta chain [Acaromyces ingoldii]|uniref:Arginine biosynthesis bifunctional protein ArgJ, mitochondrial n=1 Tax=Acaromyces ingoldii TaxID=215250 RepID=A0A316YY32_9BASI|nr:Arginine biosynthesis bifunctional protein ArgJ beta chain [Acaromyces ingoldii]PWN94420.1 Arginine biosynthesis bifunctional protein ArgJ beta chain [Acaromyces ingoldii]